MSSTCVTEQTETKESEQRLLLSRDFDDQAICHSLQLSCSGLRASLVSNEELSKRQKQTQPPVPSCAASCQSDEELLSPLGVIQESFTVSSSTVSDKIDSEKETFTEETQLNSKGINEIPLPKSPSHFYIRRDQWALLMAQRKKRGFKGLRWTTIVARGIRSVFPYCSFAFTGHRLKMLNSTKKGPEFTCGGYCRFVDCPVTFRVILTTSKTLKADVWFSGGCAVHRVTDIRSRYVRSTDRSKVGERLQVEKPRAMYLRSLGQLTEDVHISGCRDEAPPVHVLKQISYEARTKQRVHKHEIISLQKMVAEQKHPHSVLQKVLLEPKGVMLWSPCGIQIYQQRCKDDIVYLDATGSLLLTKKGAPPFYIYELVVRHPQKGSSPFPVASFFTTEHTTASVAYFLMAFVTDVRKWHGRKAAAPVMLVCDGSMVLMQAISIAFIGKGLQDTLACYYRIATGAAGKDDWKTPIIHRCLSHIMRNAKEMCKKYAPKHYSLAMHVFGLFTSAQTMAQLDEMLYSAAIVFGSPCVGPNVAHHFAHLQSLLQCIPSPESPQEEEADEELEADNDWGRHFQRVVDGAQVDLRGDPNPYYSDGFLQHLNTYMLPYAGLWSGIMLGDLGRHGKDAMYKNASKRFKHLQMLPKQNITTDNRTQGIMEKSQWDLKHLRNHLNMTLNAYKPVFLFITPIKLFFRTQKHLKIYGKAPPLAQTKAPPLAQTKAPPLAQTKLHSLWQWPRTEVVVASLKTPAGQTFTVRHTELCTLKPHIWLNGEIVEHLLRLSVQEMGQKIYIMDHYTAGVMLFGERKAVARSGLSKVNFEEFDGIMACVNINNCHWKLLYINAITTNVYLVDPSKSQREQKDSNCAAKRFRLDAIPVIGGIMRSALGYHKTKWTKFEMSTGCAPFVQLDLE
ncbi:hypothetical protein WMY93_031641 [Mugilogobius chulae]|uniref:Ubiquitin-like protease family profile domain-containing protein n=1 Tax=Mugilogobius chulae TaxID=88201 RepID=A0AAW0MLL1_9GOBI